MASPGAGGAGDAGRSGEGAAPTVGPAVASAIEKARSAAEPGEARAAALKDEGNVFFKEGKWTGAIDLYTAGIEQHETAVLYGNRAFANLKLENYGLAIADATKALELDPSYLKGYYRRGAAYMALSKFKDARAEFRAVVKLRPRDKDARKKLAQCDKEVKREAFEAAIAVEDEPPVSETINVEDIAVPDSYTGPRIPETGIDRDFVIQLMQHFKDQKGLHKKYALQILIELRALLKELPSLLDISLPEKQSDGSPSVFNVCGDTHGQYYDLLNIFELNGLPSEDNPYLFNGDYVDRGSFSVENVLVLFAWKLVLPNHMHLTRGNHETKNMNKVYGFEGEVNHKLDKTVMEVFTEVFNVLPLCAVVNNKVFIAHGGIFAEDGVKLDDIRRIDRFREPPEGGLMSDLLWSDPQPFPGRNPSKRGVGMSFGPDVTKRFLSDNGLELLIRSHEVKDDGYLVEHDGKCITVFSAPNYCDQMGNKGAVVRLDYNMKPDFLKFDAVPHPPIRPMAYAAMGGGLFGL